MYMNILKKIVYVAYDNVYSLCEFLSKPIALDVNRTPYIATMA